MLNGQKFIGGNRRNAMASSVGSLWEDPPAVRKAGSGEFPEPGSSGAIRKPPPTVNEQFVWGHKAGSLHSGAQSVPTVA